MNESRQKDRDTADGVNALPGWLRVHQSRPNWLCAPVDLLVEAWAADAELTARWHGTDAPASTLLAGTLHEVLGAMVATPNSAVLLETSAGWSAMFRSNTGSPWAPIIAAFVPCEVADFQVAADDGPLLSFWWQDSPSTRMDVFRGRPPQRGVRVWEAAGKWHFEAYGRPLWFESVSRYRRNKRRERLDMQTLIRYASELGIPLDDLNAYTGRAVLLHPESPPQPRQLRKTQTWRFSVERAHLQLARIAQQRARVRLPAHAQSTNRAVPASAGMSLQAWFNAAASQRRPIAWWGNPIRGEIEVGLCGTNQIYLSDGQVDLVRFVVTRPFTDATAHQLIVTFDPATTTITVYLDGEQVGRERVVTGPWDDVADITTLTLLIPQHSAYFFGPGTVDIRLYSRVLVPERVKQRYMFPDRYADADEQDSINEWARYYEHLGTEY